LRSREIPLITRKWKDKRKVKLWDRKSREISNDLTNEAIIKTAQQFKSSSLSTENINIETLKATLSKVNNDQNIQQRPNIPR
jgi:hypothetical protein